MDRLWLQRADGTWAAARGWGHAPEVPVSHAEVWLALEALGDTQGRRKALETSVRGEQWFSAGEPLGDIWRSLEPLLSVVTIGRGEVLPHLAGGGHGRC